MWVPLRLCLHHLLDLFCAVSVGSTLICCGHDGRAECLNSRFALIRLIRESYLDIMLLITVSSKIGIVYRVRDHLDVIGSYVWSSPLASSPVYSSPKGHLLGLNVPLVFLVYTERGNTVSRRVLLISLRMISNCSPKTTAKQRDGMVSERRSGGICQLIDTGRNRPCLSKFLTGRVTVVVLLGLIVAFVGGRKHIPTPLKESSIPTSEKSTKLKQFLLHLGILYCSSQCNIKFTLKLQPLTLRTILRSPSPRLVCDQHSNISIKRHGNPTSTEYALPVKAEQNWRIQIPSQKIRNNFFPKGNTKTPEG